MQITKKRPNNLPLSRHAPPCSARRNNAEDGVAWSKILKNALLGMLASIVSSILLISIFCAIAISSANPNAFIFPCALASLLISCYIGGFVCAKKTLDSPLMCGVTCGAVNLIFMLLSALCLTGTSSSQYSFFEGAALHIIAVLFTILGAFTGNSQKIKRKAKRRFGK